MTNYPDLSRAQWRKSSRSSGNGQCTEVAHVGTAVAIRDSKNVEGGCLLLAADGWQALVRGIRRGQYDLR